MGHKVISKCGRVLIYLTINHISKNCVETSRETSYEGQNETKQMMRTLRRDMRDIREDERRLTHQKLSSYNNEATENL